MSVKLSWSHYCELLTISDADKRSFYEKESINSGWSIRELKRQISTSLYERLLLSEGKTNKETVLALAEKGIEMATPLDIIKDPYVYLMRADRIWRVKHNGKNDQSNRQGKTVCKSDMIRLRINIEGTYEEYDETLRRSSDCVGILKDLIGVCQESV